jgi:serine/threonine-protein kinase
MVNQGDVLRILWASAPAETTRENAQTEGSNSASSSAATTPSTATAGAAPRSAETIQTGADANSLGQSENANSPSETQEVAEEPVSVATPPPMGNKVARIRYQVPPLTKPLMLRIEITDPRGTRTILNRNARSSENIRLDANYSQEAVVTILLDGDVIWQERYQ